MKTRLLAIALTLAASVLPANAADQLLPGRSLVLRSSSSSQRGKFAARSDTIVAPAPGGPDDPTTAGATLEIIAGSGESATLAMPAAGWTANQAGTAYRFRSSDQASAVKASLLKNGSRLKVVARTTGITLDEPSQGSIGLVFTVGTIRYCAL